MIPGRGQRDVIDVAGEIVLISVQIDRHASREGRFHSPEFALAQNGGGQRPVLLRQLAVNHVPIQQFGCQARQVSHLEGHKPKAVYQGQPQRGIEQPRPGSQAQAQQESLPRTIPAGPGRQSFPRPHAKLVAGAGETRTAADNSRKIQRGADRQRESRGPGTDRRAGCGRRPRRPASGRTTPARISAIRRPRTGVAATPATTQPGKSVRMAATVHACCKVAYRKPELKAKACQGVARTERRRSSRSKRRPRAGPN